MELIFTSRVKKSRKVNLHGSIPSMKQSEVRMRNIKSQLHTSNVVCCQMNDEETKMCVGDKRMHSYKFNDFDKCSSIIKMSFLLLVTRS